MSVKKGFALYFGLVFGAINAWAFDPSLDWKTLKTQHFDIHFEQSKQVLAEDVALYSEKIHSKLSKKLKWVPKKPTQLVITDHTDLANGYASPLPFNRSVLFVHPPLAGQMNFESWLESLITHEYTHVLHLDKAEGAPGFLHRIFGRLWFLHPNLFQPSWIVEGFATYQETDHQRKIGRGSSTMFATMMRAELINGFKSISEVNMSSPSWPLNARYLYGYYFFEFIESTYGKSTVDLFIDNYSDNLFPYLINTNSNNVLGKNLSDVWIDFEVYLREKLLKETGPWTTTQSISSNGFFKHDIDIGTDKAIYVVENDGVHQASLKKYHANGDVEHLTDINYLARIDYGENELLIAQPEVCDEYNLFFDLYLYSENEGSLQRLTHCQRYSEAVWSHKGNKIFALKSEAGIFQVDQLDRQGKYIETIWQGKKGETISYLASNKAGNHLIAAMQKSGSASTQLVSFDFRRGVWQLLAPSGSQQWYPQFIGDSDDVIFSSDHSGRFNLYRISLKTGKTLQLTQVESGVFKSVQADEHSPIYTIGYSARGFDVERVSTPIKHSVTFHSDVNRISENQTVLEIDKDKVVNKPSWSILDYSPKETLIPKMWLPFAVGNQDTLELGIQTNGMDALENHQYLAALSVDVDHKLPNALISYQYDLNWQLIFQHYHDIEVTKDESVADRVEENHLFQAKYLLPFTKIQSQWRFSLGVSHDRVRAGLWNDDQLNYSGAFNDGQLGFSATYNSASQFARSVNVNDGRQVDFTIISSDAINSDFTGRAMVIDWREYFQVLGEHSIALRVVAGEAEEGGRLFRLGGYDSDRFYLKNSGLISHDFSLRGYDNNQFTGRKFRLGSIEYRFPIVHFERTAMAPPIGLEEISASLFIESGNATDDSFNNYYSSTGLEVSSELKLFYFVPIKIRLGYANGHNSEFGEDKVYFQFGTSF